MNASFVIETLREALSRRKIPSTLLFHSDRGSQYTCAENGIVQSFSKKGCLWDNSVMEPFFKYAKQEEFSRRSFVNISGDCGKCCVSRLKTYLFGKN